LVLIVATGWTSRTWARRSCSSASSIWFGTLAGALLLPSAFAPEFAGVELQHAYGALQVLAEVGRWWWAAARAGRGPRGAGRAPRRWLRFRLLPSRQPL